MFGVGDGVADDVFEEHLQHAAGLLVDEATNAFDATTSREAADGRLGDALDVVTEHLAVLMSPQASASDAVAGHTS